ncbi:MAG: hypothetical protein H6R13_436 [Proteobacteria bacterium]|nr:hypothetical protein [Pseudomonadota bacterium]
MNRHDFRCISVPVSPPGCIQKKEKIVSMEKQMEMAQLLARFKLQVKRALGESVDLESLTRNPAYARQRLSEIEEAADDEDLLVMVLRLRDCLLPVEPVPVVVETPVVPPVVEPPVKQETRSYLMGARSW